MKTKTLNKQMNPLHILSLLDRNSIALFSSTLGIKLTTTLLFAPTQLSNIATYVAIVAGVSTFIYNAIRIVKEMRK